MDKPDKEAKRSLVKQQTAVTQHPTEVSWLRCWRAFLTPSVELTGCIKYPHEHNTLASKRVLHGGPSLKLNDFSAFILEEALIDFFSRRFWKDEPRKDLNVKISGSSEYFAPTIRRTIPSRWGGVSERPNLAFHVSAIQRSYIVHSTLIPIFQTTSGPIRLTRTSMISLSKKSVSHPPSPLHHSAIESYSRPQRLPATARQASTH